jgi:hypothetical protein
LTLTAIKELEVTLNQFVQLDSVQQVKLSKLSWFKKTVTGPANE